MKPYQPNLKIREIKIGNMKAGGDTSYPFMKENENSAKALVALEIPYVIDSSYPAVLKEFYGDCDFEGRLKKVSEIEADLVSVKFNIERIDEDEIKKAVQTAEKLIKKPLILRGANNTKTDKELVPLLAKSAARPSIIAFGEEETYESIIPAVIQGNHILSLRSPIDINLAKELNILSVDMGLPGDRILIDPDTGGLGYGLEYGYSIIERIKQAAFEGDKMLNMPIIVFIGEETYRAKEAKNANYPEAWGDYETRAQLWESAAAAAMISAGTNIIVLWHPDNVNVIRELVK